MQELFQFCFPEVHSVYMKFQVLQDIPDNSRPGVIPGFLYNKDNSRTVPGFEGFPGLSMKFKVLQNNIDHSRAVPGFKCFLGV